MAASFSEFNLQDRLMRAIKRGDVSFSLGVVGILVVLMLPLPPLLLDIFLAMSLTFSVLILMTVLFIEKPLEFNSFPTILLVATMMRLSLNVASTRLILSNGHEGPAAAGNVIKAFGSFLMSGNFVIGIIVFAILVIVNFVVITKGSGRIAEVAARFTLDSMPGKQMAIDADLSSGLIKEDEARARRKELEDESNFFGAMDGASKFVRGDAIAGLLITFINVIAGIIIGIMQKNLSFGQAAQTYTLLTVGDGLISQVPALIVSTAAGMLVSKSGEGTADKAMIGQLSAYPVALGMSSFLSLALAVLPGIPMLPFVILAGITGYMSYSLIQKKEQKELEDKANEIKTKKEAEQEARAQEEPIKTSLEMDAVRLELGYALLPMANSERGKRLTDQIKALRRQIASEMGFVLPSVRIQDNLQLDPNTYVIRIKEIDAGKGDIRPNMLMAMDPTGNPITLTGEDCVEPAFGLKAKWISNNHRDEAERIGLTVVEPSTVVTTHLTEVIKENMPEMLSYDELEKLVDDLEESHQKLMSDLVPGQISMGSFQRVLQNLLAERVSVRDLHTILEAVSEATALTKSVHDITEHVRSRLARQITYANLNDEGVLPIISLSANWETKFHESIIFDNETYQLAMAPSDLQLFIEESRKVFDDLAFSGEMPVLLTTPKVRPFVRMVVERYRPLTAILSQNEVHPRIKIKTVGQI